jgi:shikimate dehydrogenase
MTQPQAKTRYAVIGRPVAHSRSPFIHACFARQTGERVDYGRIECAADTKASFAQTVQQFAAEGAGGCNVTVPFKFDAIELAARHSERAALAGAANVLRFDAPGDWYADNTDGIGLVRDIEVNARRSLAGVRLLLVGAGGAAAGVLGPLLLARPREIVVVNRTGTRAEALVARHAALALSTHARLDVGAIEDPGGRYDIVVNATASSLQGTPSPVPASTLGPGTLAVDLMYGSAALPFLAWAQAAGAEPRDGLGMLVEQAAEAFHVWRGVRPATAQVLQSLREQVAAAT